MKTNGVRFFGIGILVLSCLFLGWKPKKKFLDYFVEHKTDSLVIISPISSEFKEDPKLEGLERGTSLDSSHFKVFMGDAAEDILNFSTYDGETGPMAYYKIKLNAASGYYLLIIRSGGEYWNSRYYACLYNSGDHQVNETFLVAENFGDAGYVYTRQSTLKRVNKGWTINSSDYYQDPVNFSKYETDSLMIREVNTVTSIELSEEHYHFKEVSKKEKSYHN